MVNHEPDEEHLNEAQFARRLDQLIGGLEEVKASPGLKARILADMDQEYGFRDFLAALWPFGTLWPPATVLASAAILGMGLGLALPAQEEVSLAEDMVALAFVSESALEDLE
jgi:hypothetical protein